MNPKRHLAAHARLYRDLVAGNTSTAAATQDFYDEYGAVMDMPAEFYLETVGRIFQEHQLATGQLTWRGERVDPAAIERTALFTVEGAKDDICSPGQTYAAHACAPGSRPRTSGTTSSRAWATTASSRIPLGGGDLPAGPGVHRGRARRGVGRVDGLTALLLLGLDVGTGLRDDGVPVR